MSTAKMLYLANMVTHTSFEPYKRVTRHIVPIVSRHTFVLVNAIIFSVAVLLYVFSDVQAAIFLACILLINTFVGIVQDLQAMLTYERLQLITAPRVTRLHVGGTQDIVFPEVLNVGDHIRVNRGDQVPCDGSVVISRNVEMSEALITGESDTFPKNAGDSVLAGSIVTAGSADVLIQTTYRTSRISQMSGGATMYHATQSPIQRSVSAIITYSGVLLLVVIAFVAWRGVATGDTAVHIVKQVGALASVIVPQGLIVVTTLLFAFGAASYSRRHVLFQEINAAEKLGRIKNLCMDKTGTLTDNELTVTDLRVRSEYDTETIAQIAASYVSATLDDSSTARALKKYTVNATKRVEVFDFLPFSSWRSYGGVHVRDRNFHTRVLIGSADTFLPHCASADAKAWVEDTLRELKGSGKRLLCMAEITTNHFPRTIDGVHLNPIALFIFESQLREGVREAVSFFQNRGVRIRILSGDNPETAQAIARSAGITGVDSVITGPEMTGWDEEAYQKYAHTYGIFARILPEQKVKVVEALRGAGFTAMIGDGANDALAIRRADLGIAMFDGAQSARQLAAVVLMNNNFTALPGAVRLADSFIQHLEVFSSIFLYQSMLGFFFFVCISGFGYAFPFTPLNITPINYFAVGMPGVLIGYWALRPKGKVPRALAERFIKRILIFPLVSSLAGACAILSLFLITRDPNNEPASSTLFSLAFILLGLFFFTNAPKVYNKKLAQSEWYLIGILFSAELLIMAIGYNLSFVRRLFEIQSFPSPRDLQVLVEIMTIAFFVQWLITEWLIKRSATQPSPLSV